MNVDWTNLSAVLFWIVTTGGPYIVGEIFSFVAENWVKWHTLPRVVKFVVPMLAAIGIGVGANALLQLPDMLAQISPLYALIAGIVMSYFGTQKGYMEAKKAEYAKAARDAANGKG